MKKGQGQLVAFVLLIGFTVVIGVMVGNWMIKNAGQSGEKAAERAEVDMRCADVSISVICSETAMTGIKNTGYFTITNLKINGVDYREDISPKDTKPLNILGTVIPFIKIDGKEVGCTTKSITIDENTCGTNVE